MNAPRLLLPVLLAALVALALPAAAANYADDAAAAARAGHAGYTVYVDVTFGMRKDAAARELNQVHVEFAAHGFEPVAVTPHEENGDLQGFFVTYRRRD